MGNLKKQFTVIGITAVIAFAVIIISALLVLQRKNIQTQQQAVRGESSVNIAGSINEFSYKGQSGKNALSLLGEKAEISRDKSGMVASINGRVVDQSKHEFWAFFVNGKLASVGPADYITRATDIVEWKIQTY